MLSKVVHFLMLFSLEMPLVLGLRELAQPRHQEVAAALIYQQQGPMKRIVLALDVAYAVGPSVAGDFRFHSLVLASPILSRRISSMGCCLQWWTEISQVLSQASRNR